MAYEKRSRWWRALLSTCCRHAQSLCSRWCFINLIAVGKSSCGCALDSIVRRSYWRPLDMELLENITMVRMQSASRKIVSCCLVYRTTRVWGQRRHHAQLGTLASHPARLGRAFLGCVIRIRLTTLLFIDGDELAFFRTRYLSIMRTRSAVCVKHAVFGTNLVLLSPPWVWEDVATAPS